VSAIEFCYTEIAKLTSSDHEKLVTTENTQTDGQTDRQTTV